MGKKKAWLADLLAKNKQATNDFQELFRDASVYELKFLRKDNDSLKRYIELLNLNIEE